MKRDGELERLAADLYFSDIMLGRRIGSRLIHILVESELLTSHRDLFSPEFRIPDLNIHGLKEKMSLSDTDRQRIDALNGRRIEIGPYFYKAEACLREGIRTISRYDDDYPKSMKVLEGMPVVLYYRGNRELLDNSGNTVAVVGSRNPSHYGIHATREIVKELCAKGVVIVSGLARGIDTAAHSAAIENDGLTIAVNACGLDIIYPPENRELFLTIEKKGLLVSEMPPGQEALRRYFPARNRIMSALSDLVAIMEAGEFSGTHHTASFALAQGRDVFVLPGSIYSTYCRGNLMLLRDGADILLSADDILSRLAATAFDREMDVIRSKIRKEEGLDPSNDNMEAEGIDDRTELIVRELRNQDQTLDELVEATGICFSVLAPLLSELIISGVVTENHERFALTFPDR